MRIITIKIPTSFKEWKNWIQERAKTRKRHNQNVLWEFAQAISREVQSKYWSKDISDVMVDTLFRLHGNSKLTHLYFEAKNKIR